MRMDYVIRRLGIFLIIVWAAATINFFIPRMSGQNPVRERLLRQARAGGYVHAGIEDMVKVYDQKFGLDKPLWLQYFTYLGDMARLDFNYSIANYPRPVIRIIAEALPWTVGLLSVTTLMDFPGTIHVAYDHFVEFFLDVCKSFAYHGFKRHPGGTRIVSGHGSNTPLLEFVGRRTILETDALAASFMWWNLLRVDPNFIASFRESVFPGGCGHACEVETSVYLHLCGEKVQMDKAEDHNFRFNAHGATGFQWADAFGAGPVTIIDWTSRELPTGVMGQPTLATADKGRRIFEEAVTRLVEFVGEFQKRPDRPRVDHHAQAPTSPLPKA
jgi:creatinine amidohydrolase/Fe(II)-dependent formamide hydrolase-like protein